MKKLIGIATILIFCSIVSYAQNENINNSGLIRIADGDTTFIAVFRGNFEINIDKKEVFIINPVMNYLDIKDGKPKYEVGVRKEKWDKIMNLLLKINLSDYEEVPYNRKMYSITLFFEDYSSKTYTTQKEIALENLKEIIQTIRE